MPSTSQCGSIIILNFYKGGQFKTRLYGWIHMIQKKWCRSPPRLQDPVRRRGGKDVRAEKKQERTETMSHGHDMAITFSIPEVVCTGSKEDWEGNINYRWGRGSWDHPYPRKSMEVEIGRREEVMIFSNMTLGELHTCAHISGPC